jgi:hypothetical protein
MLQGWPSLLSFPQSRPVWWCALRGPSVHPGVPASQNIVGRVFFGWNVFIFINYDEVWSIPPKEMIQSGPWRLSLEKNRISWSSSPAPARPQFWRRKWLFSRQACPSGTYSAEVLDSKGSTFACSWVETCWNMLKYRELGPPLISDRGTTWYLSHSNFNGKYMGPSNKLWNA